MKIYTHITPSAEQGARNHARYEELENLLRKIYEEQTFVLLTQFDNRFWKKDFGRDFRAIFTRHETDEICLICAFAFLSRGDSSYDFLWKDIKLKRADDLYENIQTEDADPVIHKIKTDQPPPPPLPKEPTDEEHHWLNPEGTPANQVMVLEADAWIKNAQTKNTFMGSLNYIHKVLQETIYNGIEVYRHYGTNNTEIPIEIDELSTLDGADFRIHYFYFSRHQILLLLDLTSLDIVNPTDPINKGEELSEASLSADIDRETLIRCARRAYPLDVFLLEKEQYFQIQQQQEGNLALSPEESDVLAHVYRQSENRFPLFINGRAGSGKSTLLQYLLKDYLYLCFAHWDPKSQYFPLYLTYSNNLLQTARQHVEMLLEANADILLKSDGTWVQTYEQKKNDVFDKTFKRFRDFLITLLPEEMTPDFQQTSRIGYAQFKRIWHDKAPWKQREKYSVDLVWHIIRTYIKGMAKSENEYLTPEAYRALPRKHRSVADADYDYVFKSVWKTWYGTHCKEVGAWDDQDLALRVLGSGLFPTCYPAIFCDEAQDFTALELKILYHLSLFSERTVPNYAIGNIPFVFAGDPLQTLNPTGFRWEAVKASFHDFLLGPIESRSRTKSDLNYQELAANYRSSKPVVDFCNYIQLLRLCLFGDTYTVRPQEAWFSAPSTTIPFLVSVNSPEARGLLSYSALVIIPDCHEEEEGDYVNQDPLLSAMIELDEAGTPSNVLSPTMAKGLEYDEIVVLYRFGATCPPTLIERIQEKKHREPDPSLRIEWEYFFNRLYVAASRARRRLVILDEPQTFDTFWKVFRDRDAEDLAQHLETTIDRQEWGSHCLQMIHEGSRADIEKLRQDRVGTDSSELSQLAEKWYREGLDAEKPQLLRRARQQFQRIDENTRAIECYANALRLEEKFADAAREYLKIDDQAAALDCLWAIPDYSGVKDITWQGDIQHDVRIELARTLGLEKGHWQWTGESTQAANALRRLYPCYQDAGSTAFDGAGWQLAVTALLNSMKDDAKQEGTLPIDWAQIRDIARATKYPAEHLATIAFNLGRMRDARNLWEQSGKTANEQYHRSVYATSEWPETLKPLKALAEYETVVSDWEAQDCALAQLEHDPSLSAILVDALVEKTQFLKAIDLLTRQRLVTDHKLLLPITIKLWNHITQIAKEDVSHAGEALKLYFEALVESGDWKTLATSLQRMDGMKKQLPEQSRRAGERGLVAAIAFSRMIETLPGEAREQISNILHQRYHRKGDGWLPVVEKEIELHLMGAAIEQANRISDAMDYYQWAVKLPRLRAAERSYFDERIAACLDKRIQWNINRQNPTQDDERRLNDLRRKLGDSFLDHQPDPSRYPGSGFLPAGTAGLVKERKQPISPEEKAKEESLAQSNPNGDEAHWLESLGAYAELLANLEKWGILSQELGSAEALAKRFPKITDAQIDKALTAILKAVVEPMATSDKLVAIGRRTLQAFSDVIIPRLQDNAQANRWNGCDSLGIDHDIAGAVIERLGRDLTAIQFYEWALDQSPTRRGRLEMAKRLIVSRERYADYLEGEKAGQQDRAIEQRTRARRLREDYDLLNKKLSSYPEI